MSRIELYIKGKRARVCQQVAIEWENERMKIRKYQVDIKLFYLELLVFFVSLIPHDIKSTRKKKVFLSFAHHW